MKASDYRLDRGAFFCLLLVTFLTAIGNTGLISIMPAIGRTLRISDFLIASIFSLSALLWALSSPYWAGVSDRRGHKPLIQLGMIGFIISMVGCSLAIYAGEAAFIAPTAVFTAFFLCRASYGVFGSAAATATQAFIAARSDEQSRVQALTGLAGALSLGTIFGPAIAPFLLVNQFGLIGPLIGFALLAALALILTVPMLPADKIPVMRSSTAMDPERKASARMRDLLGNRKIAAYLYFGLALAAAQAIHIYSVGFVVIDRVIGPLETSQQLIGIIMCGGAVAGLIGQWGLVRWLAMTPLSMIRWGGALAFGGNMLMMINGSIILLGAGFAVASLGYGFGRPGFSAGASIAGAADPQSTIAAAVSTIAGASIVLPPMLAVAIYELWRPAPFLICLLLLAIAGLYAFFHLALHPREHIVS